jgi:hypothetical protein
MPTQHLEERVISFCVTALGGVREKYVTDTSTKLRLIYEPSGHAGD